MVWFNITLFRSQNSIKNTLPTQSFVFAFSAQKTPLVVENRKGEPDMLRLMGRRFRVTLIYSWALWNAMILRGNLNDYYREKSLVFAKFLACFEKPRVALRFRRFSN
jgi:hypothetical protein